MSDHRSKHLHRSKYRFLGLVGQGQFGRVYCAIHRKTGRLVALKELNRERFSTHKFLRELRFLLSLQHENIVTCYALEQTSTGRYLVMDYCEGGTLRSLMHEDVRLHPIQGLKIVAQILSGLSHAHDRGIVHCDIKPENILLSVTAEGWTARISDFGIARLSQEESSDFSNTGSPAYMAPERFYGQYSPASDLYAVGVLLFEILVGHRPFSGSPAELMSAHLNQAVTIPTSVSADLRSLLLQALQKLPARRFHSADEMLTTLQAAIATAEAALSRGWSLSRLLSPRQALTACAFGFEYQENLRSPISQLVRVYEPDLQPVNPQFFRVSQNWVERQTYLTEPAQMNDRSSTAADPAFEPTHYLPVRLPDSILDLIAHRQKCFAVTRQAVYQIPLAAFEPNSQQPLAQRTLGADLDGQIIELSGLDGTVQVTVSPDERWLATATPFERSHHMNVWNVNVWNVQRPSFKPMASFQAGACFQSLALDSRHIAVFSNLTDRNTNITGVAIEVFSRRGNLITSLQLPVPLRSVAPTSTPYHLISIEPNYSHSLLFLNLKPLRVQRIGLDISPHLLTTLPWGYALISQEGEILLLNQQGQSMGQIAGPANPTAIASLDSHRLLIATWSNEQGNLYVVNLQQLDLDILF